jgi:hypothetical protein
LLFAFYTISARARHRFTFAQAPSITTSFEPLVVKMATNLQDRELRTTEGMEETALPLTIPAGRKQKSRQPPPDPFD